MATTRTLVVIAGGGTGGLATALAVSQEGVRFHGLEHQFY
jgi:cation diffusion facilitator CzcD-associated flavoprotein CzcO